MFTRILSDGLSKIVRQVGNGQRRIGLRCAARYTPSTNKVGGEGGRSQVKIS